jgi:hypothetical protein
MLASDIRANRHYTDSKSILFVLRIDPVGAPWLEIAFQRFEYTNPPGWFTSCTLHTMFTSYSDVDWTFVPVDQFGCIPLHPKYMAQVVPMKQINAGNAMPYIHQTITFVPAKCECGAAACRSPMHSSYCPLYIK